jgi:branched-subunit amino acid transport protein AzlD
MKASLNTALILTFAMGGIIFFCRLFPFLFFREKTDTNRQGEKEDGNRVDGAGKKTSRREIFLNFVEKLAPPAAMTVLAFNSIAGSFTTNLREGAPVLIAAVLTALVHLWKRNSLFSIFGGTAAYMILERIIS